MSHIQQAYDYRKLVIESMPDGPVKLAALASLATEAQQIERWKAVDAVSVATGHSNGHGSVWDDD